MNRLLRTFLLLALTAYAAPPAARAQAAPVGEIARIAEQPRKPVPTTLRAVLWRAPGQPVRTSEALIESDRIELKDDVWIDLHLRRGDLDARVVLAPLERRGVYRIEAGTVTGVGGLRLAVERGAMLVELLRGELEALAADVSMIIHGTTVLIQADSTGAYCFLKEGHISFPSYEINLTGERQMWRLEPGQRPQLISLGAQEASAWQAAVRETHLAVRPVPLWKKPAFLIGAAVVVGAGAYLLWPDGGGARGTVTIPIPR